MRMAGLRVVACVDMQKRAVLDILQMDITKVLLRKMYPKAERLPMTLGARTGMGIERRVMDF